MSWTVLFIATLECRRNCRISCVPSRNSLAADSHQGKAGLVRDVLACSDGRSSTMPRTQMTVRPAWKASTYSVSPTAKGSHSGTVEHNFRPIVAIGGTCGYDDNCIVAVDDLAARGGGNDHL